MKIVFRALRCPYCGSLRVRRSRRSWFDRLVLRFLLIRPFRCTDCYRRFFGTVLAEMIQRKGKVTRQDPASLPPGAPSPVSPRELDFPEELLAALESLPPDTGQPGDHRASRRVQMNTLVRIRRAATGEVEVVAPLNVSRGGFAFEGRLPYQPQELIYIALHHRTDSELLEAPGRIVRISQSGDKRAYGVEFRRNP